MNHPELNLYYFPSCPFCQFVLAKINELKIDTIYSNIHENSDAREKLYQDTADIPSLVSISMVRQCMNPPISLIG